jgi:raffinose/stachyose/melibiose transport system substrate-binding protein
VKRFSHKNTEKQEDNGMITSLKRIELLVLTAALLLGLLSGCGANKSASSAYEKADDIITFEAPQNGKEIVRIGFGMNTDWEPLMAALNKHFPDKQFIYDFNANAGISPSMDTVQRLIQKNNYDFLVANYWYAPSLGADISNETFLDNYLQTTLDSIAADGHIYGIPLPTAAVGIYYNKDLFKANGWTVPASTGEFFTLCKKIRAAGYTPYANCLKYEGQTTRALEGMIYDELFASQEGMGWYGDLISGKATFAGNAEPMFELAKTLFDEGVFTLDDFSASLTEERKDFLAGKIAMIDYTSDLFGLAKTEGCGFEIGLAPYPSTTGKNPSVLYNSSAVLYIPKDIQKDSERYKFDTSVLEYLSTSEGQDALLSGWTGVVSLKNYTGSDELYDQVSEYVESGTYHTILSFSPSEDNGKALRTLINQAVRKIGEGTSVDAAVAELDESYSKTLSQGAAEAAYEKIASAADDFTVMETSYYIADRIREATGADVALVPNGGYYRSNMADIPKGDITNDMRLFYQKGIGGEDYITSFKMTGAQLKALLEHPIINGREQTQFVAASGLKIEYAPWHKSGGRVVSAALEDGTAIDDAKTYTVAAYAGVVDESYITSTLRTFDMLDDPQTFIENALRKDGTVTPDIGGRVKLDWDIQSSN